MYVIKVNSRYVEPGLPWTLRQEITEECLFYSMGSLLKTVDKLSYESGTRGDREERGWVSLPHYGHVEVVEVENAGYREVRSL